MNDNFEEAKSILDSVVKYCLNNKIDFFCTGETASEDNYIVTMYDYYYMCLCEILDLFPQEAKRRETKVLEIGSFYGIFSLSLKQMGFQVTVQDIPEFNNHPKIQERYHNAGIICDSLNLNDIIQPYDDQQFDIIVMCEVIEHLNFNPLPVLTELSRVMKPSGLFYVTTPNQTSLSKRFSFVCGKSIHHPIEYFVWQNLGNTTMIIGIHWREYTKAELYEIMSKIGMQVIKHSFGKFNLAEHPNFIRKLLLRNLYSIFPDLLPMQSLVARKV